MQKRMLTTVACAALSVAAASGISATASEIPGYCVRTDLFGGRTTIPECVENAKSIGIRSSLLGMTVANVCAVLGELQIPGLSPEEARRCHRSGVVDARNLSLAVKAAQGQLGTEQDGWLKSDEFVELTCRGVTNRLPHSDRFAGWMFATGRGLPQNLPAAHALLERGLSRLLGQAESMRGADLVHENIMIEQTKQVLAALADVRERPPTAAELDNLCAGEVKRVRQRAIEKSNEAVKGKTIASSGL